MAGKEENEQKLNLEGETDTTPSVEKAKGTVKKVAKKRAAKKKVTKKRAVTKRALSRKTTVKAASAIDMQSPQAAGQSMAEEGSSSVAEDGVNAVQRSAVGTKEIKADNRGVTAASSERPQEEKSTMSEQLQSKAVKSSPLTGFWPKVLVWVVVVLAAFMYIRSLAHKGQTVKQEESPASTVVIGSAGVKDTPAVQVQGSAADSTTGGQSSPSSSQAVAKIGQVAIEKGTELGDSAVDEADSEPSAEVSVAPSHAVSEKDKTAVPDVEQPAKSAVAPEPDPAASITLATKTSESAAEPVATTERGAIAESSSDHLSVSIPKTESVASGAGDAQSPAIDAASETVGLIERGVPSEAVVESAGDVSALPEMPVPATPADDSAGGAEEAQESAATDASAVATAQSVETSVAAVNAASEQETNKRGIDAPGGRPSFKELFGYERPEPPIRMPDQGSRGSFPPDRSELQRLYPVPRHYAPRQPWGGGYPGQYGPYGNYGGYPYYPGMPEWTHYQPYGYGPSSY